MRLMRATAILAVAWGLGGCGASQRQQVQAKVEQFARATAAKDYHTICDQVLAPVLLSRLAAAGIGCRQAMQIALDAVRRPSLSIGSISVSGTTASAITLSGAQGQRESLAALELVKTAAGWRISSLGSVVRATGGAAKRP